MLTVLSLFSGVGGIDLGLERAGMQVVGQVEIDPYCQRVLTKHWPAVPRHDDVHTAAAWWLSEERPHVDLIAGGFPCQPVSAAGKKLAQADTRWLWPAMASIIADLRPDWVLWENVPGLLTRGLDLVHADLVRLGYRHRVGWATACGLGAPHARRRLLGLAHTARQGRRPRRPVPGDSHVAAPAGRRPEPARSAWWAVEPRVGGGPLGLSTWLDGGGVGADAEEARSGTAVRALHCAAGPQTVRPALGGPVSVPAPPVLRPAVHGGGICQRHLAARFEAETGYPIPWDDLRVLWGYDEPARAPRRRELGQRFAVEHPDLVRLLSQQPPPPCSACWADGSWESAIPRVRRRAPGRAVRIHALGNSVVPQVAEHIGRLILAAHQREVPPC